MRIRGSRGHPEVRQALIRYARWLRKNYEFPIRVPVYLLPGKVILTGDGKAVTASFFAPYSQEVEPFIRIATGDYLELKAARLRDNALAAFITSLSHEVIHYFQWVNTGKVHEKGVSTQALSMLRMYASEIDNP